jgi:hypothetical protein
VAAAPATANLIQVEEDNGPGLMMACIKEVIEGTEPVPEVALSVAIETGDHGTRTCGHIFLNE